MNINDMAAAMQDADDVSLSRRRQTFSRYRRLAEAAVQSMCGEWITVHAETAHYVSEGRETILCDRLPSPVTLVVKLAESDAPVTDRSSPASRED